METKINRTLIAVVQGDITTQNVDAIVNAANASLLGGGGVNGAIRRAGGPAILEECDDIRAYRGGCPPGQAVITTGGDLPAKYVIHTVGPEWRGGESGERETLASCYRESLTLALNFQIKTIAFPSISTGIFGYPSEKAAIAALKAIKSFLEEHEGVEEVRFVLFDDDTYGCYEGALRELSVKT